MIHNVNINIKHLSECLAGGLVDNFNIVEFSRFCDETDCDRVEEKDIAEFIRGYLEGYLNE